MLKYKIVENEDNTCPICLDVFSKPRELKCGHIYCNNCIESLLEHNHICFCQQHIEKLNDNIPHNILISCEICSVELKYKNYKRHYMKHKQQHYNTNNLTRHQLIKKNLYSLKNEKSNILKKRHHLKYLDHEILDGKITSGYVYYIPSVSCNWQVKHNRNPIKARSYR